MNTSCCTNPIRINTLLIKNRIVFPAMCTKYAAPDGGVTERMLRYYEERAKGGAGLVTIEMCIRDRAVSVPQSFHINSFKEF